MMSVTAQSDAHAAFTALSSITMTRDLTGLDLGGTTLMAGAYHFSSSGFLTGTLTLDGQDNPESLFVFVVRVCVVLTHACNFLSGAFCFNVLVCVYLCEYVLVCVYMLCTCVNMCS